jgi:hypothetical protein
VFRPVDPNLPIRGKLIRAACAHKDHLNRRQCNRRHEDLDPGGRRKERETETESCTPESDEDQSPDLYRDVVESNDTGGRK